VGYPRGLFDDPTNGFDEVSFDIGDYTLILSDGISLGDSIVKDIIKGLSDTILMGESIVWDITKVLADGLKLVENEILATQQQGRWYTIWNLVARVSTFWTPDDGKIDSFTSQASATIPSWTKGSRVSTTFTKASSATVPTWS